MEYGLDPVNDPAGTLACMDAVFDEQLASLDAEHDWPLPKRNCSVWSKPEPNLKRSWDPRRGIEEACEETGGRLRKLVIEANSEA